MNAQDARRPFSNVNSHLGPSNGLPLASASDYGGGLLAGHAPEGSISGGADRVSLAGSFALEAPANGNGDAHSESGFDHGTIEEGIEQQSALNKLKRDQVMVEAV